MELLKNKFFQKEFIYKLADGISLRTDEFDSELFLKKLTNKTYTNLELKEKLRVCAVTIGECLRLDYFDSIDVLMDVVTDIDNGFNTLVFPEFIDVYGREYFDKSLEALEYFTVFGSSEFAIRSFANKDIDKVLIFMKRLAKSDNEHKRRFASEGCRPKLPWAKSVKNLNDEIYVVKVLEILDILKEDTSKYVRKSVANNINDISKLYPKIVLKIATNWINKNEKTDWILKHGLRTLLKEGNKDALRLWGFDNSKGVEILDFHIENDDVYIGDTTYVFVTFNVKEKKKIRGDFRVHYLKNNGSHSTKTFSFFKKTFTSGTHAIKKKISFKEMSTRKHYVGMHKIDMVINGDAKKQIEFNLYSK